MLLTGQHNLKKNQLAVLVLKSFERHATSESIINTFNIKLI